jgi:hypothetical protein
MNVEIHMEINDNNTCPSSFRCCFKLIFTDMLVIRKFEVNFDRCSVVSAEDKTYNNKNKRDNAGSVVLEIYVVGKYTLRTVYLSLISIRV